MLFSLGDFAQALIDDAASSQSDVRLVVINELVAGYSHMAARACAESAFARGSVVFECWDNCGSLVMGAFTSVKRRR